MPDVGTSDDSRGAYDGGQTVNLVIGNHDYGIVAAQITQDNFGYTFDFSNFTVQAPQKSPLEVVISQLKSVPKVDSDYPPAVELGATDQGLSKAGTSLFNGPLLASAGMSDMQPTYLSKAPEYTPGIYNGKVYNMYVPWCGTDINSGGWRTVEILDTTLWDFNISRFASGFAAPRVDVKPIVEAGGAFVYSHQPDRQGVAALGGASLLIGSGESFLKSLDKTPIQVIRQGNNGDTRIIIQVGLKGKFFRENAGKTVTGSEDTLTNKAFRLTLDAQHAQDPFTAFMSINENGQFVLTPKVYSGDKFEVGRSGFWGASDFQEIPMSPTIISKDGPYKSLADKLEEIFSRW